MNEPTASVTKDTRTQSSQERLFDFFVGFVLVRAFVRTPSAVREVADLVAHSC